MDKLESRARFRFSLRALVVAATFAAVLCYWLMLPTINAQRFVHAVKISDFSAADSFFRDPKDRILEDYNKQFWKFDLQATLEPVSASQLLKRERRVNFHIAYGGPKPLSVFEGTITSHSYGLTSPEISGGVTGGMSM
jgi:hypothetical protein